MSEQNSSRMDQNQIKELIKLINQTEIGELKIQNGDFKISIRRKDYQKRSNTTTSVVSQMPNFTPGPAPTTAIAPPTEQKEENIAVPTPVVENNGKYITMKSPMIGSFYRSPGPDKEPYVKVGDTVEKGQVLCMIEAMKLFNEIESEYSGTIVKVLIDNSSPVEYDQALFLIDPQ